MAFRFFNRFKTILVVEDDASLRRAVTEKLAQESFKVLEAGDGEAGLSIALREHPDLLLLDLMLPKMDGMTMLERLREDAWGSDAAVVVITNLGETDERRQRAEQLKVLEYIDKSRYTLEELLQKVERALRG